MTTFVNHSSNSMLERFQIICWSVSRNDTRIRLELDKQVVYEERTTYAALNSDKVTTRVTEALNEWLTLEGGNAVKLEDLHFELVKAIQLCESKYGYNSSEDGDALIIFKADAI